MKTAISIPDDTFGDVERRASSLGMSRSEFFTRAARCYLERLDAESLTGRIDAAAKLIDSDDSGDAAVAAARLLLAVADDQW